MRIVGMHPREAQAGTIKLKVKSATVPFSTDLTIRTPHEMQTLKAETDQSPPPASILDFRRSVDADLAVTSDDSPKAKSPTEDGSPALSDLDRILVEAAEEMNFNWSEFLPVERIKPEIAEIVLATLLVAGLVAFGHFLF
jgi:hypothetical protein